jgi:hypothetical protein
MRVEAHSQPFGQYNERYNGESGQCADQERQNQKNLFLALL